MSIRIELDTKPLDDLIERLKTAPARVQAAAQRTIAAEAMATTERIRARWPILTGYSSMRWKAVQLTVWRWIIQNAANYAAFVHAKGDSSRTPLLHTWIADEIAMARARLLVALRAAVVDALRNPAGGRAAAGGRLPLSSGVR